MRGIFVTGTDTNVGKTWVGKHLIQALCEVGIDVVPRKPIESGWSEEITETDAWILANAANRLDDLNEICPNRFKSPVSPVRAAEIEGKKLSLGTLKKQCLVSVGNEQFLYVEGAGGFYSPLCFDGLNADLAQQLNLPVLLVVANRLGCINHALLTIEAIKKRKLTLWAIILNDVDASDLSNKDMDNLADLKKNIDCPLFSTENNQSSTDVFKELAKTLSNKPE